MSWFSCCILGLVGSALRSSSLSYIKVAVTVGIRLCTFCILPAGIKFYAAMLIILRKILSLSWTLELRVALENCSSVNFGICFLKLIKVRFGAFIFLISAEIEMWLEISLFHSPGAGGQEAGRGDADAICT